MVTRLTCLLAFQFEKCPWSLCVVFDLGSACMYLALVKFATPFTGILTTPCIGILLLVGDCPLGNEVHKWANTSWNINHVGNPSYDPLIPLY